MALLVVLIAILAARDDKQAAGATVHSVVGLRQARAVSVREAGFTVLTIDRTAPHAGGGGEVILQRPAAGTEAPVLTHIRLYVGR